jgi:hypothetical protein
MQRERTISIAPVSSFRVSASVGQTLAQAASSH